MPSISTPSGKLTFHATRRGAFTLFEVIVAATMLAVLLTTSVQMLRAVSNHERASERRVVAMEAVQAVGDQIANIPWRELTPESAKKVSIPKPLDSWLPGAKLTVSLDEEASPTTSKRIHVDITWNGPDGQAVAPVGLTSWAFPERSRPE
jgi:hypothetical protein